MLEGRKGGGRYAHGKEGSGMECVWDGMATGQDLILRSRALFIHSPVILPPVIVMALS